MNVFGTILDGLFPIRKRHRNRRTASEMVNNFSGFNMPTGRNPSEPEVEFMPFPIGRRVRHFSNIDYATLERQMFQAAVENEELLRWSKGQNPTLKVRITEEGTDLYARFGDLGLMNLGDDTDALEEMGYRIDVQHRRDYYDEGDETVKRLRPSAVRHEVAAGALFVYDGGHLHGKTFNQDPLPSGGDTLVRIYAPSGHWAEGRSVCAEDDTFDKAVGRTIALSRALFKLNEVVCRD